MLRSNSDRGVSTVIDVGMALLFISASVLVLGVYLGGTDDPARETGADATVVGHSGDHDELSAAHATEVLSESTISVTYSVEDVKDEDELFDEPVITNDHTYRRTDHGSPIGLMADAALANHQLDGEPVLAYGDEYEEAVDWTIRENLLGAERNFYIIAEWEPYEGAGINGTATAGERPPPNADISSTTTTVPSGFEPVDEERLEEDWMEAGDSWDEWIDGIAEHRSEIDDSSDVPGLTGSDNKSYTAAGTVIGESVVNGFFPPARSQYALENQGINRELKVYHYQSMVETIGEFSFRSPDTDPPLVRHEASAERANRRVLHGYEGGYAVTDADSLAAWIGADIPRAFEEEFAEIDEEYDGEERDRKKVETVIDALSIEDVTITIQTWNE